MANLHFERSHNAYYDFAQHDKRTVYYGQLLQFLQRSRIRRLLEYHPIIVESYVRDFWNSATYERDSNCIRATVAGQSFEFTVAQLRESLQLGDDAAQDYTRFEFSKTARGIAARRMGYTGASTNSIVKSQLFGQWRFFAHLIVSCLSSKKSSLDVVNAREFSMVMALAYNKPYGFSSFLWEGFKTMIHSAERFLLYPRFVMQIITAQLPNLPITGPTLSVSCIGGRIYTDCLKNHSTKPTPEIDTPLFGHLLNENYIAPPDDGWEDPPEGDVPVFGVVHSASVSQDSGLHALSQQPIVSETIAGASVSGFSHTMTSTVDPLPNQSLYDIPMDDFSLNSSLLDLNKLHALLNDFSTPMGATDQSTQNRSDIHHIFHSTGLLTPSDNDATSDLGDGPSSPVSPVEVRGHKRKTSDESDPEYLPSSTSGSSRIAKFPTRRLQKRRCEIPDVAVLPSTSVEVSLVNSSSVTLSTSLAGSSVAQAIHLPDSENVCLGSAPPVNATVVSSVPSTDQPVSELSALTESQLLVQLTTENSEIKQMLLTLLARVEAQDKTIAALTTKLASRGSSMPIETCRSDFVRTDNRDDGDDDPNAPRNQEMPISSLQTQGVATVQGESGSTDNSAEGSKDSGKVQSEEAEILGTMPETLEDISALDNEDLDDSEINLENILRDGEVIGDDDIYFDENDVSEYVFQERLPPRVNAEPRKFKTFAAQSRDDLIRLMQQINGEELRKTTTEKVPADKRKSWFKDSVPGLNFATDLVNVEVRSLDHRLLSWFYDDELERLAVKRFEGVQYFRPSSKTIGSLPKVEFEKLSRMDVINRSGNSYVFGLQKKMREDMNYFKPRKGRVLISTDPVTGEQSVRVVHRPVKCEPKILFKKFKRDVLKDVAKWFVDDSTYEAVMVDGNKKELLRVYDSYHFVNLSREDQMLLNALKIERSDSYTHREVAADYEKILEYCINEDIHA